MRWMIPEVLHKSQSDIYLWQESQKQELELGSYHHSPTGEHVYNHIHQEEGTRSYRCSVDASWIAPDKRGGYAWNLIDRSGALRIVASGAMRPSRSVLEAEAYALREAIARTRSLGYSDVVFCTDSQQLLTLLQQAQSQSRDQEQATWRNHHIAPLLADILHLLRQNPLLSCVYITRKCNKLADGMAKRARLNNFNPVVKWTSNLS